MKNLPRTQTTLDIIWACFVCDVALVAAMCFIVGIVVGMQVACDRGREAASVSRGVVVVGDGWWESLKLPVWDNNKQPSKSHIWLQTQLNGLCMATGYINPCKPPTIFKDYPHLY